jgi:hypothetical protein
MALVRAIAATGEVECSGLLLLLRLLLIFLLLRLVFASAMVYIPRGDFEADLFGETLLD